ncbi:unnamed protein product, partial [Gadus morhua 'NCC']
QRCQNGLAVCAGLVVIQRRLPSRSQEPSTRASRDLPIEPRKKAGGQVYPEQHLDPSRPPPRDQTRLRGAAAWWRFSAADSLVLQHQGQLLLAAHVTEGRVLPYQPGPLTGRAVESAWCLPAARRPDGHAAAKRSLS